MARKTSPVGGAAEYNGPMSESASDPPKSQAIGLAHTMVSDVVGAEPAAAAYMAGGVAGFPVAHWDKYEFLELLGRGGMGAVYKARDRRLGRIVALKFIASDDPAMVQRFIQEARAQARLVHPHICKVYEVGIVDNKPYIAMEFVAGQTLDKAIRNLGLFEKLHILKDTAHAVHAAHEQGIIHRDLKPSNILVERSGETGYRPVIMDFGLARDSGSSTTHGLTESGAVMGTPAYMSPEQARGDTKRLDRRSDVYSLGATIYDVLSGKPPFEDQTVVNLLLKVLNDSPRPLRSHDATIPEAVELIVSKCLNKEPEQRYETAQALAEDLARFLGAQRIVAKRLSYSYRLLYWSRHNRALSILAIVLAVSLLGFASFSVRSRIIDLKKEEQAKKEAALAQKLGQSVEGMEWLVRTAYLLPLHDTSYEKGLVRERMAAITAELAGAELIGARLGAYVLGRGHLALHEWDAARAQLGRAIQLGYQDAELDYALGRVLGELYSKALEDARKSGDNSFFEKRKKELKAEYLEPALSHLQKSRHKKTISPNYVDGLIDYYEQRYDAALLNAHMARRQAPWLYEAAKLEGDVYLNRALEQRDRGELDPADRSFAEAIRRYEEAASVGHSDHLVHEAMAEAWLRWEETDMLRGRDVEPKLKEALAAADRALEAAPKESSGHTKKAYAYYFQAQQFRHSGQLDKAGMISRKQIAAARQAIAVNPLDAYAYDSAGIACFGMAELEAAARRKPQEWLAQAYTFFEKALKIRPRFPWAYNDYALSLTVDALERIRHNQDPTEAIEKSSRLAAAAITIDPSYLFAHNTKLINLCYQTRWYVEHGKSPGGVLDSVKKIDSEVSRINDKYITAKGNVGVIYYYAAVFNFDNGFDVSELIDLSVSDFRELISVDPRITDAYAYISFGYALLAAQAAEERHDPDNSIRRGLETVKMCYQVVPKFPDCQGAEGLLRATEAGWARQQGRPFLASLKQAQLLGKQATQQNPDSEELQLPLAQISYQLAIAQWKSGARPLAQVKEGLAAADHALKISTGWPRALAQKGALLLLRAKLEIDKKQRRDSLAAARASFGEAFSGNPLLRRRFGGLSAEADRLWNDN